MLYLEQFFFGYKFINIMSSNIINEIILVKKLFYFLFLNEAGLTLIIRQVLKWPF